jgi:hypothetical protein
MPGRARMRIGARANVQIANIRNARAKHTAKNEHTNLRRTRMMTTREQARHHAQEIYHLGKLIRNAVDAGVYNAAQEKLKLLAREMAELSEALNRVHLDEQRPQGYEHPEHQE